MPRLFRKISLLLLLLNCCYGITNAQQVDSARQADTARDFLSRVRKIGSDETTRSIGKYKAGRIAIRQDQLLQDIKHTTQRAKIFLKNGIDTAAYQEGLAEATANLAIVQDGIFINKGTEYTQRNLAVSAAILHELLLQVTVRRERLASYIKTLVDFRDRIDSLSTDSALYTFPADSIGTMQYLKKLAVLAKEIGPADTILTQSISSLQHLQTDVDLMAYQIQSNWEDVERLRQELTSKTFSKEFPAMWEPAAFFRPIPEIIRLSLAKEKLAFGFYIRDFSIKLIILVLLVLTSFLFLRSLKEKLVEEKGMVGDYHGQLVIRYPLMSAIIIVISIFQFIFPQPPFIFGFLLWTLSAVCLGIIFYGYVTPFWMRFWAVMVFFSLLAGANNMVLQASRLERWFMLGLSLAGALYSIYILRSGKRSELRERGILYFVAFVALLETGAVFFNLFGRYNLAKTLMVSGFTGVIIAILFLWTIRLINQGLRLIASVYKHPDRRLFYINFDRIGEKVPGIFYFFLVLGWFILVGRNFYAFQQAARPFTDFLNTERTVGNYTFTINSLFIFVLILAISVVLSQIISFFAGEQVQQPKKDPKVRKPTLGSWLLLVRIFILTIGLFFAFAAAGIPLDRLTIVLGALGVGIGLGLQGLVSNLVSGLIIAFEKPVNVGDAIEVNGKPGTMKSIGFRSSVVTLADGACLIIPNSDLLSQHLVNWTMGRSIRRLVISVSVSYDSDLKKVKNVLEKILEVDDRILQYPEPMVVARSFEDSSIAFDVMFWVKHISESLPLKSELITLIHEAFRKEGIDIPFPQQELRILPNEALPDNPASPG